MKSSKSKKFKVNTKKAKETAEESAQNEKLKLEKQDKIQAKKAQFQANNDKKKGGRKPMERKIVRAEGGVFAGEIKSNRFSRGSGGGGLASGASGNYVARPNMFSNYSSSGGGGFSKGGGHRAFTGNEATDDIIRRHLNMDDLDDGEDPQEIYERWVGGTDDFIVADDDIDGRKSQARSDGQVNPIKLADPDILTFRDEKISNYVEKWRGNDELCLIQMPHKLPINLVTDQDSGVSEQANCSNFPYGRFGTIKIYRNEATGEERAEFEIVATAVAETEGEDENQAEAEKDEVGNIPSGSGANSAPSASDTSTPASRREGYNQPNVKFSVNPTNDSAICQELFTVQSYDKSNHQLIAAPNLKNFKEEAIRREITMLGNVKSKVIFSPMIS